MSNVLWARSDAIATVIVTAYNQGLLADNDRLLTGDVSVNCSAFNGIDDIHYDMLQLSYRANPNDRDDSLLLQSSDTYEFAMQLVRRRVYVMLCRVYEEDCTL